MEICPDEDSLTPRPTLVPVDSARAFENKCKNDIITIDPPRLKFVYHSKKMTSLVHFHTLTGHSHVVRVVPPGDRCFKVDVTRCTGLVRPGFPFVLEVTFKPQERRCHSDWLKVVCREDVNLMIPLEAIPYTPNAFIPKKVDLGCPVLGSQARHRLPIHPLPYGPVVFGVFLPEPSPDFAVQPVGGRLEPDDPPAFVEIVYTATAYKTVHFPVQLFMPQVSTSPFLITVTASCRPNVPRLEPPRIPPVDRPVRERIPLRRTTVSRPRQAKATTEPDKMAAGDDKYYDVGLPWPSNAREEEQRRVVPDGDELLGPFGNTARRERELYEEKRRDFLARAEEYRKDNVFPPIRTRIHKPGQGLDELGPQSGFEVYLAQEASWRDFQTRLKSPGLDSFLDKTRPTKLLQRPTRDFQDRIVWRSNNNADGRWILQYQVLEKFVEAARTVLVLKRLERRLAVLTKYRLDVLEGRIVEEEEGAEGPSDESSSSGSETSFGSAAA